MIKKKLILFVVFLITLNSNAQKFKQDIIGEDVENFWQAYDSIRATKDSLKQLQFIKELYFNKRTMGLEGFIKVRRYKEVEFVNAINKYPNYFNSIRNNALLYKNNYDTILSYVNKLEQVYPNLVPSTIYFSVGVFRSGGTYYKQNVLLGVESLSATQKSVIHELPQRNQNAFKEYAPYDIPLTALHEYIHTQQDSNWIEGDILKLCVAEGVAEFISTLLSNKPLSPPVKFGKENKEKVLSLFMEEILHNNKVWNWLWNTNENELKVNELGYYIGYEICENYYNKAKNKQQAIKELIDLNYNNEIQFAKIVDKSGFLPLKVKEIDAKYEQLLPSIIGIEQFKNKTKNVKVDLNFITIIFSEKMDACCRSFDMGSLGKDHQILIDSIVGWNDDKTKFTFSIKPLSPNKKYQLVVSNFARFQDKNRLEPYLIEFKTVK